MGRPTVNEAEAGAQASDDRAAMTRLARDVISLSNTLEKAAGAASGWLDDPRTSAPPLAGERARLLSACVAVGAVVIGREG